MEDKIIEVTFKLTQLKDREKSFNPKVFVKNIPIMQTMVGGEPLVKDRVELMKGSTLNIQIIDGVFEQQIVGDKFLPMIEVVVNN